MQIGNCLECEQLRRKHLEAVSEFNVATSYFAENAQEQPAQTYLAALWDVHEKQASSARAWREYRHHLMQHRSSAAAA